jgi:hypothetical protein
MSSVERLRGASVSVARRGGNESATLGEFGFLVGGKWRKSGNAVQVRSPYNDELVAVVHRTGASEIADAICTSARMTKSQCLLRSIGWRHAPTLTPAESVLLASVSAGIMPNAPRRLIRVSGLRWAIVGHGIGVNAGITCWHFHARPSSITQAHGTRPMRMTEPTSSHSKESRSESNCFAHHDVGQKGVDIN